MYVEHIFTEEEFEYLKTVATKNNMAIKTFIKKEFKKTLTNHMDDKDEKELHKKNNG
jgi:hypothetical protein